jgi:hypothetical protein
MIGDPLGSKAILEFKSSLFLHFKSVFEKELKFFYFFTWKYGLQEVMQMNISYIVYEGKKIRIQSNI